MMEAITQWLQNTCTANPYWLTAIVSVIPTIEVRGAITLGISLGLNPWITWLLACVSALIVCPILLLCLVPVLRLLKRIKIFEKFANAVENLFVKKAEKIEMESSDGKTDAASKINRRKALSIFLFVAIPLPLTGVWTGSAVAAFLNLDYKYSVPAIVIGNFTSGLIITLLNLVLGKYAPIIFLVLIIFVAISIVSLVIALFVKNKKPKTNETDDKMKNEDDEVNGKR